MSTHYFSESEIQLDGHEIRRRLLAAGYTNPVTALDRTTTPLPAEPLSITVDQTVSKSSLKSDLTTTDDPSLSVSPTSVEILADGAAQATITVQDSRGAAASGKKVLLTVISQGAVVPVDADMKSLDGSGQADFIFGPIAAGCCSSPFSLRFVLVDQSSKAVTAAVQFVMSERASLTVGTITYQAQLRGSDGNSISVEHTKGDEGFGFEYRPLQATLNGQAIQVIFGTDALGVAVTPTVDAVLVALSAVPEIIDLVRLRTGENRSVLVEEIVPTSLSGGSDGP